MNDNPIPLSLMLIALRSAQGPLERNGSPKTAAILDATIEMLPRLVDAAKKSNDKLEAIITKEMAGDLRDYPEWLALDHLLEQLKE
jgi:hypothetical protein